MMYIVYTSRILATVVANKRSQLALPKPAPAWRFGIAEWDTSTSLIWTSSVTPLLKVSPSPKVTSLVTVKRVQRESSVATVQAKYKQGSEKLALVHSDLCQMDEISQGGAKYFMTLLDDYSRRIFIYLLKTKDKVAKFHKRNRQAIWTQDQDSTNR